MSQHTLSPASFCLSSVPLLLSLLISLFRAQASLLTILRPLNFDASTQSLSWLTLLTSYKCLFIQQVQSLTQAHHHPLSWFSFLLLCCCDRTLTRSNTGRKGFLWFPGYSPSSWRNQGRNWSRDNGGTRLLTAFFT